MGRVILIISGIVALIALVNLFVFAIPQFMERQEVKSENQKRAMEEVNARMSLLFLSMTWNDIVETTNEYKQFALPFLENISTAYWEEKVVNEFVNNAQNYTIKFETYEHNLRNDDKILSVHYPIRDKMIEYTKTMKVINEQLILFAQRGTINELEAANNSLTIAEELGEKVARMIQTELNRLEG